MKVGPAGCWCLSLVLESLGEVRSLSLVLESLGGVRSLSLVLESLGGVRSLICVGVFGGSDVSVTCDD